MSRPRLIDCFPVHDELDILEMRLTELYDVVDAFVAVEADVTHQDAAKPYHITENLERFAPFKDKLVVVRASGLPTLAQDPDPWARELAQREHIATGLNQLEIQPSDVVMQSDVDEIPFPRLAGVPLFNAIRPAGDVLAFGQRGHFWAVDWLYPKTWFGTVAAQASTISRLGAARFGHMRTLRNQVGCRPHMLDAGWHFSWLGGPERVVKKVNSFCHPEVEERIRGGIANDNYYWREGWHVDGERMAPVDVNDEWPKWIRDGNAPQSWYRPRIEVAA